MVKSNKSDAHSMFNMHIKASKTNRSANIQADRLQILKKLQEKHV